MHSGNKGLVEADVRETALGPSPTADAGGEAGWFVVQAFLILTGGLHRCGDFRWTVTAGLQPCTELHSFTGDFLEST